MKHIENALHCPSCEEKLKTAHPDLANWYHAIKVEFPTAHIAWAWRGEKDQNQALKDGATTKAWPLSKHNKLDDQGNPCSLALDLFEQINGDGIYSPKFYFNVYAWSQKSGWKDIEWAGNWKRFIETMHFEIARQTIEA